MQSDDLLGAMHAAIYTLLVKRGVDELTAIADTQEFCNYMQQNFGGQDNYLPALSKESRQRQVVDDLRAGLPPEKVAEKHKMHPRTVEKIIAKEKQKPGDDPGLGTKDWVL